MLLIPATAETGYLMITAVWCVMTALVAAAAFDLPLQGVHGRLAAEKDRLRSGVGRRTSMTISALHAAVDRADGAAMEVQTRALAALEAERELVRRVLPWPWSTAALTRFVSAVLLPLGPWLVTRLLERLVWSCGARVRGSSRHTERRAVH